jgi:hypothetical protein
MASRAPSLFVKIDLESGAAHNVPLDRAGADIINDPSSSVTVHSALAQAGSDLFAVWSVAEREPTEIGNGKVSDWSLVVARESRATGPLLDTIRTIHLGSGWRGSADLLASADGTFILGAAPADEVKKFRPAMQGPFSGLPSVFAFYTPGTIWQPNASGEYSHTGVRFERLPGISNLTRGEAVPRILPKPKRVMVTFQNAHVLDQTSGNRLSSITSYGFDGRIRGYCQFLASTAPQIAPSGNGVAIIVGGTCQFTRSTPLKVPTDLALTCGHRHMAEKSKKMYVSG